jgi:hypothetical protein
MTELFEEPTAAVASIFTTSALLLKLVRRQV